MSDPMTALGLMSGTSMDGIDAAILITDGERTEDQGTTFGMGYSAEERAVLKTAAQEARFWQQHLERPAVLKDAETIVTQKHIEVVQNLISLASVKPDLIGFHGQTVLHRPEKAWTVQLGDPAALAKATGIDVVSDFRQADMAAGGQGAPFAPLYHKALIRSLPMGLLPSEGPVVVVNLGGVGNVTYIDKETVIAFDTGPANGPIDDWVQAKAGLTHDQGGAIAAAGKVDEERVRKALTHGFFGWQPPKSIDRQDFTMKLADGLTLEDGAATLTAFSAISVAKARDFFPSEPIAWIACGGGRHNPTLLMMLSAAVPAIVYTAEDLGWRGDHLEAEAFAFLAVRSVRELPLSLPTTTGVKGPTLGGNLYKAKG